jgi:hypothetical protein
MHFTPIFTHSSWKISSLINCALLVYEIVYHERICHVIKYSFSYTKSRAISVGIATAYGLDDREVGVRVPAESRIFTSSRRPDRLWGAPNLLSNGYQGAVSPGVKRQGREADR